MPDEYTPQQIKALMDSGQLTDATAHVLRGKEVAIYQQMKASQPKPPDPHEGLFKTAGAVAGMALPGLVAPEVALPMWLMEALGGGVGSMAGGAAAGSRSPQMDAIEGALPAAPVPLLKGLGSLIEKAGPWGTTAAGYGLGAVVGHPYMGMGAGRAIAGSGDAITAMGNKLEGVMPGSLVRRALHAGTPKPDNDILGELGAVSDPGRLAKIAETPDPAEVIRPGGKPLPPNPQAADPYMANKPGTPDRGVDPGPLPDGFETQIDRYLPSKSGYSGVAHADVPSPSVSRPKLKVDARGLSDGEEKGIGSLDELLQSIGSGETKGNGTFQPNTPGGGYSTFREPSPAKPDRLGGPDTAGLRDQPNVDVRRKVADVREQVTGSSRKGYADPRSRDLDYQEDDPAVTSLQSRLGALLKSLGILKP